MKRLEKIREISQQRTPKKDVEENFEKLMRLIRRYNPPIYPSVNPVPESYRRDKDKYDDAA
jgi:hypothetical protein